MGKYLRAISATAYQVEFSDADKDSAKKGIPTSSHGNHIKYEDGEFSVLIHLGDDAKLAKEGDWVVEEEGGRKLIVSDEDFDGIYHEAPNDEDEDFEDTPVKTDPSKALEPDQTVPEPQEPTTPAPEGAVVTD